MSSIDTILNKLETSRLLIDFLSKCVFLEFVAREPEMVPKSGLSEEARFFVNRYETEPVDVTIGH